jgi:hypothetical protein
MPIPSCEAFMHPNPNPIKVARYRTSIEITIHCPQARMKTKSMIDNSKAENKEIKQIFQEAFKSLMN